jgi:hypothetical protein
VATLIVRTLAEGGAFALGAFGLGCLLARALERAAETAPAGAAFRVLVGFGALGYVTMALALAHALRWWTLLVVGIAALALAQPKVRAGRLPRGDPITFALSGLAVAMASGQFLAALAPPEATDELAYHLPIARAINSPHAAQQLLHARDAYGNLPNLGEALYAAALAVDGTALVHVLHLAVVLAGIAFAASVVRSLWGPRAGALSAAALLAFPGLTYNATTAYVDAAAAAFELAAALLVLRWFVRGMGGDLVGAALLLGFAVGVKYTALFTAALAGAVVLVRVVRRRQLQLGLAALVTALVGGGFWYAKNLVRFGNPFWPFYLGHRGMDDRTYAAFVAGVHAFGPRTLHAFVQVPWRFASVASLVPFLAMQLGVLALLVRREPVAARALVAYAALYVTYWFWLASHQARFLLTGTAAAIVATAIAVVAGGWVLRAALVVAAVAAIAVAQSRIHPFAAAAIDDAVARQFGSPKAKVTLGLESRGSYLRRYFGCEYDAVQFLDRRPRLSPVLVRQVALVPYFADGARFGRLPLDTTTAAAALHGLRRLGFRAAYVRASEPGNLATTDAASAAVQRRLRPIWEEADCTIYRVARGPR